MTINKENPEVIRVDALKLSVVIGANGLLRIANSTNGILIGFYLAYLAVHQHSVNAALLGAIGTTSSIAELAGAVPFGLLADRYPLRNIMFIGSLIASVTTLFFGLTHYVVFFLVLRAIEGVAAAASTPSLLAFITDVTQEEKQSRGKWMGYFEISFLVGLALGGLVGGRFWDLLHPYAFGVVSLIYLVTGVFFLWGVQSKRKPSTRTGNSLDSLKEVLTNPLLKRLAPAWLAVNAIIGMWLNQIGFQLTRSRVVGQYLVGHFSATRVGFMWLGFAILFAIGVIIWGYILPLMTRVHALLISLAGVFLTSVLLYFLNIPGGLSLTWQVVAVILLALAVMDMSGFAPTALAYLADIAGMTESRGSAMGVYTLLFGLGSAIGAGLGGLLARSLAVNGLVIGTVVLAFVSLAGIRLLASGS
jgi:MFS family permease